MSQKQQTTSRGSKFIHNDRYPNDKVPPQDIELEKALLGGCIIESSTFFNIAHLLDSDCFYDENHSVIYKAIEQLVQAGSPVDMHTVANKLKSMRKLEDVGGSYYISTLTNRIGSTENMQQYAMIIYQKYVAREITKLSAALYNVAFKDDFDELESLFNITTARIDKMFSGKKSVKNMTQVLKSHLEALDERIIKSKETGITGVSSGLVKLDQATSGWQPGDLIIIGARPGMGKTAVALKLAKSAAEADNNVLIFSLEMNDVSLADRLICSNGGIDSQNLRKGRLSKDELNQYNKSSSELHKLPIFIDDSAKVDIKHIRAVTRSKVRKNECNLLIIDYLQLIEITREKFSNRNREQEISEVSRSLKVLAKELGIPIILLCQLSRAVEARSGNKRPQLSDLRESGSIEQDADAVMLLYRPSYYDINEDDNGYPTANIMLIDIAKQRSGPLSEIPVKHSDDLTQIYDLEGSSANSNNNDNAPY